MEFPPAPLRVRENERGEISLEGAIEEGPLRSARELEAARSGHAEMSDELRRCRGQVEALEALLGKSISWLNERKLLENIDPAVLTDANMARRRFLRQHCVSGITFIILVTLGFWLIYDEWPVVSRFLDSETSLLPHIVYGVLFAFFVLVIKDDTSLGFSRYLKEYSLPAQGLE